MADIYLQTYRNGGGRKGGLIALSKLIDQIQADDQLRVLDKLADTGLWQIVYPPHFPRKKIRIGGFVKSYSATTSPNNSCGVLARATEVADYGSRSRVSG